MNYLIMKVLISKKRLLRLSIQVK